MSLPVSVVIPAYNRAATIRAAIESVLRQTWSDFELIVVDDGSTDGTAEAVGAIGDPRLRLVSPGRNLGAAGARNAGVAAASGTWIAFQDSDDEWLPLKLEKQMAVLPEDTPHVAAYCGLLTLGGFDDRADDRLEFRYRPDPALEPARGHILPTLLSGNMVSTQTLVVRRDVFLELGGFDETLPAVEDWDFALRLARRGTLALVDEPLVHQRFSPNSLTRDLGRQLRAYERILDKNLELFEGRPDLLARQYYILAGDHRRGGNFAEARRYLVQARRTHPANPRHWAMLLYVGLRALASPRG